MTQVSDLNLQEYTRHIVKKYLYNLKGHPAKNLNKLIIDEVQIGLILEVLSFTKGNLTEASEILGITRTTLRNKIRKHKL
jgi:Fis family transcriptional regulator